MDVSSQEKLVDIPEQPDHQKPPTKGHPKLIEVNRQQTMMAMIYVEELIGPDHKARAIWQLVERFDLKRFSESLRTAKGCAGRPAWNPQLLVCVWVYAYSEGISSAREIEGVMEWEPGFQWLSGLEKINHHTLSDFRVEHQQALDELFAQLLAMLENAGVLSLEQVMHDGTKIRALAGADTLRRRKTLEERLKLAREVMAQMGDPQAEVTGNKRKQAAQERAARERAERLEAALREMAALQANKASEKEKDAVRVSAQEPEARLMKHGDHAIAPSYNAQISTEASNKIIVGAHLSQCSSDAQSLMPAMDKVAENLGRKPEQAVVDGGFTNRANIVECAAQNIDLVGSLPDPQERSAAAMKSLGIEAEFAPSQFRIMDNGKWLECPAGCRLEALRKNRKRGDLYQQYQVRGGGVHSLPIPNSMLPAQCGARTDRIDPLGRTGGSSGVSQEDGGECVSSDLPETRGGGGVPQRLDQRQTGGAQVPGAGTGKGGERTDVGLPDLQHHAVGAADLAEPGDGVGRRGKVTAADCRKSRNRLLESRIYNNLAHSEPRSQNRTIHLFLAGINIVRGLEMSIYA